MSESPDPNGPPAPPKPRIIIQFDPATGKCGWCQEGDQMPLGVAVNMLEIVKSFFVDAQVAQMMQAQAQKPGIVAARGPLPRGGLDGLGPGG